MSLILQAPQFSIEPHMPRFRDIVSDYVNTNIPVILRNARVMWLDGSITTHHIRLSKGCTIHGYALWVKGGHVIYSPEAQAWKIIPCE